MGNSASLASQIQRRVSRQVQIGNVLVGGDAPIMVQSMTNTDTENVDATVEQVAELARAGSEVVRITDRKSTRLNSSHSTLSRMPSSA